MASRTLTGKKRNSILEILLSLNSVNITLYLAIRFNVLCFETISFVASTISDKSKPLVIVEKLDDITVIGINRPEKRNCVNHATAKKLMEAFAEFEADNNSKVTSNIPSKVNDLLLIYYSGSSSVWKRRHILRWLRPERNC